MQEIFFKKIFILIIIPILFQNYNDIFVLSKFFNITLKVKGKGNQKILYPGDHRLCVLDNLRLPDEVIINGVSQNVINYTYYFNETENIIKLKYYSEKDINDIATNHCFFYWCTEITEIDLSEFDTSQFTSMYAMFSECHSLISLNLKNFNTSKVRYMHYMFHRCETLKSLDLSNFDTRNVENMFLMFFRCELLSFLNLSNFETPNLNNITNMFYNCYKLEYINLLNFNNMINAKKNDFLNTPENIVVCTKSDSIITQIGLKKCSLITC